MSLPAGDLLEQKRALRRSMRTARDGLGADVHAQASAAVADHLMQLPEIAAARLVAAFSAIRGELDLAPFVATWRARGGHVAYPRVAADGLPRLRFHPVELLDTLRPGAFGILEPAADLPEVAVEDIAVVLVPGLAFDAAGRRLGYGGGYYDEVAAWMRARRRGLLVGVGFDFQVVERCPAGAGDVSVDVVVTDARVIRALPSAEPFSSHQ